MPIRAAIRSITRISPLHETHAGIPKMNADYQPGQKPTMANRHVAGFVAPAFVRPRKTTARRSEVSYVPSSVRNERSDHSSVSCAGGSRARCCVENMLVAPVWEIKISRKRGWTGIRLVVWTFSQNISSEGDSTELALPQQCPQFEGTTAYSSKAECEHDFEQSLLHEFSHAWT